MRAGRRPARRRRRLGRGLRPAGHRQPGGAARRGRARGPGGWAAGGGDPDRRGRARWCRIPAPGGVVDPLDPGRDRGGDPRRARRSARSRGLPARRRAPRADAAGRRRWPRSSRAPSPRTGRPPPGSRARPDGCATLRGRWRPPRPPPRPRRRRPRAPSAPAMLAVAIGAVAAGAIAVWQPLLGLGAGGGPAGRDAAARRARCGAWRRCWWCSRRSPPSPARTSPRPPAPGVFLFRILIVLLGLGLVGYLLMDGGLALPAGLPRPAGILGRVVPLVGALAGLGRGRARRRSAGRASWR